jgi:hypothetical protein
VSLEGDAFADTGIELTSSNGVLRAAAVVSRLIRPGGGG